MLIILNYKYSKINFLRDKTQIIIEFENMKKDDNIYHEFFACSLAFN